MSGRAGTRSAEVTASARSLPALMLPWAAGTVSIMLSTWPPIRSVMAGPLPLYGTQDVHAGGALEHLAGQVLGEPLPAEPMVM